MYADNIIPLASKYPDDEPRLTAAMLHVRERGVAVLSDVLDIARSEMIEAMRRAINSQEKENVFQSFSDFEIALDRVYKAYFDREEKISLANETLRYRYFVLSVYYHLDVFLREINFDEIFVDKSPDVVSEIELKISHGIKHNLLDSAPGEDGSSSDFYTLPEQLLLDAPPAVQQTLMGYADAYSAGDIDICSLFKIQSEWLSRLLGLRRVGGVDRLLQSCVLNEKFCGASWKILTRSKISNIVHLYIENSNYLRMQYTQSEFEMYIAKIVWRINRYFEELKWKSVIFVKNECEVVILVQNGGSTKLCNIMARELQRRLERRAELSSGISMFSAFSLGHLDTCEYPLLQLSELLVRAASAVDEVRLGARGKVFKYNYSLDEKFQSTAISLGNLWDAAHRSAFRAHLQPKFNLTTLKPVGYEALARLYIDDQNIVGPSSFTHGLKDPSLSQVITKQIIADVVKSINMFKCSNFNFGHIAINLGSNQLIDRVIPDILISSVEQGIISVSDIEIEVTEDTAMSVEGFNPQIQIRRLADFGFRIALDDFGTGYASFRQLTQIPFDTLKIDGTFVRGMMTNRSDWAVVQAIVGIARKTKKGVVAEWVETEEQLRTLRQFGCQVGQGYLFGEAMAPAKVLGGL